MADVVCIGEALIDLVPERSDTEGETFIKAAGGAPANVAVGLARLGVAAAFVGTVGDDAFGRYLRRKLETHGVDVAGLRVTREAATALAVVTLDPAGERDFLFYGHPPAHAMLTVADIDEAAIASAKLVHFGTIGLIDEPSRSATLRAIDLAHRHGVRVSCDPNLRLDLWPSPDAAAEAMRLALSRANVVKLSEDELQFLQGDGCDLVESARSLWHPAHELMVVTRGRRGCSWLTATDDGNEPAITADTIDSTSAGDAFAAALLAGLTKHREVGALNREALALILRFASAAGALATTRRGGIPAMPDRAEVEALLADRAT